MSSLSRQHAISRTLDPARGAVFADLAGALAAGPPCARGHRVRWHDALAAFVAAGLDGLVLSDWVLTREDNVNVATGAALCGAAAPRKSCAGRRRVALWIDCSTI